MMRKSIADAVEKALLSSIYGGSTSSAAQGPQEPFTLEKLQKAIASLPPKETWLSSRLFPRGKALQVSGPGENFTCAHPEFWTRLRMTMCDSAEVVPAVDNPIFGVSLDPIEIDPCDADSAETAKWRRSHWARLAEAFAVACMPLPEWLRSPPEFDKHG